MSAIGVTQQVAAHGHGGLGKTALAIEYGWCHLQDYPGGAFFLRGDVGAIADEVAALALPLGVVEKSNTKHTALLVKKQLEEAGAPALLILDNVDSSARWVEIARSELLPDGNCRRLITTRCGALRDVPMYQLKRLPRDQGISLLERYRSDATSTGNKKVAGDIVDWFDGLPIGLTVIGAFMARFADLPWQDYADELARKGLRLVRQTENYVSGSRPFDYDESIHAVFDDLLKSLDRPQRRALQYVALLQQDRVMFRWLIDLLQRDPDITLETPGFEKEPAKAVLHDLLSSQLLLAQAEDKEIVSVHRVFRRWLRDFLHDPGAREHRDSLLKRIVDLAKSPSQDLVGDRVAVYSVKLGLRDFGISVMMLTWMWSNSDRMSPRGRCNSINWSTCSCRSKSVSSNYSKISEN